MPKEGIQWLDLSGKCVLAEASFLLRDRSEITSTKQFKLVLNFFGAQTWKITQPFAIRARGELSWRRSSCFCTHPQKWALILHYNQLSHWNQLLQGRDTDLRDWPLPKYCWANCSQPKVTSNAHMVPLLPSPVFGLPKCCTVSASKRSVSIVWQRQICPKVIWRKALICFTPTDSLQ